MDVFIATPAYDGKVVKQFEASLKSSFEALNQAGISATWEVFTGCCYLPIARNKLVQKFLESDAREFIFIDSDIQWTPDDLLRLLVWPVDIVAGAYRHKTWEETYPIWIRTDRNRRPVLGGFSDLIECWVAPTGFMRINREVFDEIERFCGDDLRVREYTTTGKEYDSYLNFFDTGAYQGQWWGEDSAFCRRWTRDMRRKVFVDPTINVVHWGSSSHGEDQPFIGDFEDYLSRLPGGANDPGYHGNDIDGFMVLRELQFLYSRARGMNSIVEIGSFKGRSAHALCSGCTDGIVYCVDPWKGKLDTNEDFDIPSMEEFIKNTAQFGNRVAVKSRSLDAAEKLPDADMVFIDGSHTYEAVKEDIAAWLPKARKLICGHDYNPYEWKSVVAAVDEAFGDRVRTCGTIWYVDLEE